MQQPGPQPRPAVLPIIVVSIAVLTSAVPSIAAAAGRHGMNPAAHKQEPTFRFIGSDDEPIEQARNTLAISTTNTPAAGARLIRFDQPYGSDQLYDPDQPYDAGEFQAETIPDESIRMDYESGDFVGGEYADPGYSEHEFSGGDIGGEEIGRNGPWNEDGRYNGPGFRHRRRWQPIESMVARSWDHDEVGESWLTRPFYVGGFLGAMFGDELVRNEIDQQEGFYGGARAGWDFNRSWSVETRLASASMPVRILAHEGRDNSDVVLGDIDLLWYPWGDTPWRPYVQFGFGFAKFQYRGSDNNNYDKTVFGLPWGIGFRYRWTPQWSCRVELLDNVAFGGSELIETMHNITLTGGIEYRFGGSHRTYWPWDPGREHW